MITDKNTGNNIPKEELPESLKQYFEKPSPFEVPENYFEELPGKLKERINAHNEQKNEMPQIGKVRRLNWAVGIAASIALAVFIGMYLPLNQKGTAISDREALADLELTQKVIDDYVLENTSEADLEDELANDASFSPFSLPLFVMGDDTIPVVKVNPNDKGAAAVLADSTLSAEDIYEYLNTEGFDPEDE
ncbi:MAG: hypothetical protein WCM76_11035 [Bacteroidota bacterium]